MLARWNVALAASLIACLCVAAQSPTPAESLLQPAGLSRDLGVPEPFIPATPRPLTAVDPSSPEPGVQFFPRGDLTYLPNASDRGFGITDVEALGEIRIPVHSDLPPLKVSPGFAARFWEGPSGPTGLRRPDLPGTVYDFYTDFGWRPRPFEWLFIDLKLTPGIYTDLKSYEDAFRPRGQAIAIIALSEQFQFVAGAVYTNRVRTTLVPAGGFRYAPSEDTEFRIVFPAPKISHRIANYGDYKIRAYLSGEFGGGAWAVERSDGRNDTVDYSDLRAIAGIEAEGPGGRSWHAEVGYVFDRRIDYASNFPATFRPGNTVMFRIGTSY